ncbi:MAG: type IV pili twitching motility protein PilT, partial [Gemmatimonadota bacterium]
MAWLDTHFAKMVELGASDLHVSSTMRPMFRINGDIQPVEGSEVLPASRVAEVLAEITPERNRTQFESEWDTDFAYAVTGLGRFRANLFMDRNGPGAVFRVIPSAVPTAQELGLPKVITDLCHLT